MMRLYKDIWHYLKTVNKPIIVYGMGNGGDALFNQLEKCGIKPSAVFASDDFVRGQCFRGLTVSSYKDICKKYDDFIVLTAFGTSRKEVVKNIEKIKTEHELLSPDLPIYGNTVFTYEYYIENKNNFDLIKSMLCDERSKIVFDNIINFKLSGKHEFLKNAEDDKSRIYEILKDINPKIIFDLGAFTGDTAEEFLKLYPQSEKIIAVEPDIKNYQKLLMCNDKKIIPINCAVSYLSGYVNGMGEGGRNQTLFSGNNKINCTTIDRIALKHGIPDLIKFDIEGEELNAIIGGKDTIAISKPALIISAYHRSCDLLTIPQKVLSLNKNYKMYIVHTPCIPCWDTYFIFV